MRRPTWGLLVAVFASSLVCAAAALTLSLRANAESDRKWCSVVTTMTQSYDQSPPVTPAGKQLAADLSELRDRLECEPS